MVINRALFNNMLKKVSKCGTSKTLEITQYYHLTGDEEGFSVTATDSNNYITVSTKEVTGNFEAIIKADQICKLIDKLTTETVEINIMEDHLQVIGNGTYKVELLTEEEYLVPPSVQGTEMNVFTADLKSIGTVNKSAVAVDSTDGALTGYYVCDTGTVSTDRIRVCFNERFKAPQGRAVLLTKEMVSLIQGIDEEKVTVDISPDMVSVKSDNCFIVGPTQVGIEGYPQVAVMRDKVYPFEVELDKSSMLSAIDRLMIFLDVFDNGEMIVNIGGGSVQMSTYKGSYEEVPCNNVPEEYEFVINGNYFKELISVVVGDKFKLNYGDEETIKIVQGDTTSVLSLCE